MLGQRSTPCSLPLPEVTGVLVLGGSEPGVSVPLRSMSDPDQDFDKEVCVPPAQKGVATQGLQSEVSSSYVGESTLLPVTQRQLTKNQNRKPVHLGVQCLEPSGALHCLSRDFSNAGQLRWAESQGQQAHTPSRGKDFP